MDRNSIYVILVIIGIGILLVGCLSVTLLSSAMPDIFQTARGGCFLSFGDGCNTTIYQTSTVNTNTNIGMSDITLIIILGALLGMLVLLRKA